MSNVGCRIFTEVPRPPKELVERFRGLPVANIGDNMNRIYCVDSAIRSMNGKPMLRGVHAAPALRRQPAAAQGH